MKGFCPACENESTLRLIQRPETFNVRGESITVDVEYYECQACGEEFEDPKSDYDPIEAVYEEYRRRKGMLQPEEIREFRKQHDLTQQEFSKLLGIGIATLNRYENGALQTEGQDRNLRFAMHPQNLQRLLKDHPDAMDDEKRQRLLSQLNREPENHISLVDVLKDLYGDYEADLYSGFKTMDADKFFAATKYFCYDDRVFKTKLLKLLFYADFEHFRQYDISITGWRYAHLPHGPVPDQYDIWLAALEEEDPALRKEEVVVREYVGEAFTYDHAPDISKFTTSELRVIATIKERFQHFHAKQIRDYSHEERAYQETKNGDLIPYSYAEFLRL